MFTSTVYLRGCCSALHAFPELELGSCPCTSVAPVCQWSSCSQIFSLQQYFSYYYHFIFFHNPVKKKKKCSVRRWNCADPDALCARQVLETTLKSDSVPQFLWDIVFVLLVSNGSVAPGVHKQIEINMFLIVNSIVFWMYDHWCHLAETPTTFQTGLEFCAHSLLSWWLLFCPVILFLLKGVRRALPPSGLEECAGCAARVRAPPPPGTLGWHSSLMHRPHYHHTQLLCVNVSVMRNVQESGTGCSHVTSLTSGQPVGDSAVTDSH